jgi:hypothetical protein
MRPVSLHWSKLLVCLLSVMGAVSAWAFTDPPLLDNFNRANQGPPPSSNWGNKINGTDISGLTVTANEMRRATTPSGHGSAWWNVTTFGPDVAVAGFLPDASTSSGNWVNLYLRLQSVGTSAVDGYFCNFEPDTQIIRVYRYNNDGNVLISDTVSFDLAQNDAIGCEAIGQTITAWVNTGSGWQSIVSAIDSTYGAAGHVGVQMSNASYALDDFRAETLTGGGGGIVRRGVPLWAE